MDRGIWELGRKLGFAGIVFGSLFRVDSWELEYGIEDVSSYGMVYNLIDSGLSDRSSIHLFTTTTSTTIILLDMTKQQTMTRDSTLLQVPVAGSQRDQSPSKIDSEKTRNGRNPFLLGGETPPSRQSRYPSTVPSRRGSLPPQESEQDPTLQSRDFSVTRSRGYTSNLNRLPSMLEALEAHAKGQERDSVGGKQVSRVSKGGSSRGDLTTVQ
jgi:hypothetical protein